jgi:hypothetical protein
MPCYVQVHGVRGSEIRVAWLKWAESEYGEGVVRMRGMRRGRCLDVHPGWLSRARRTKADGEVGRVVDVAGGDGLER